MITEEMKQTIIDFYQPIIEETGTLMFMKPVQKRINILNERTLYLTFGEVISSEQEAIEKGIFSTTAKELFKSLFPESWDAIKQRYEDEKTEKYLTTIKKNIGLIEIKHGWDEEKFNVITKYDIWVNVEDIEVGKLSDGRWIVQYGQRIDIDDYDITRMYFSKKPDVNIVKTAHLIEKIENYFLINGYDKTSFSCWECGHQTHWLDVDGKGLGEKWSMFKEKYCGC